MQWLLESVLFKMESSLTRLHVQPLECTRFIHSRTLNRHKHLYLKHKQILVSCVNDQHGSVRGVKLNFRVMGKVSLLLKWIIALHLTG